MNLTTLKFGAAIAATTITSSVMVSAPAQAIGVTAGNTLNFAGLADINVVPVGSNATLSFSPNVVLSGSSSVFGTDVFTPASLTLKRNTATQWSLVDSPSAWLTGLEGNSFSLTSFILTQDTPLTFSAAFDGFFIPGSTPGTGGVSGLGNFRFGIGGAYEGSITAVPTPALVPAALGFGAAMLRKRKGEEAEKKTAGAKA